MKVHFDGLGLDLDARSGPNVFAKRLARAFFESGHEVVFESSGADVSLVFIEASGRALVFDHIVQRLDGIWFSPRDFYTKNNGIKSLYEQADAVVYQSTFDQKMITKWWGHPGHRSLTQTTLCEVIHNGVQLAPVTQLTIAPLFDLRSRYKMMFATSSNWHPQKRLDANIAAFKHIRSTLESSSCLIVLGQNAPVTADPDIYYTGSQPSDVCDEVYAASDWMLHLAWLDHCPNVVVEALAQGTPVICSNSGGTRELVSGFGLVLDEEVEYDFQLIDYDSPPPIDVRQITSLPGREKLGPSADISVKITSMRYIDLFKRIIDLKGKET